MIQFDNQGYLKPASPIELDLKTLEEAFTFNPHRQQLFERYISYLTELKSIVDLHFEQWIDGSFVSKKTFPNDIDILSFVPSSIYTLKDADLYELKQQYKPQIDALYLQISRKS